MALNRKVRAKSARDRKIIYENSANDYTGNSQEFLIGHYLKSLNDSDKKISLGSRKKQDDKPRLTSKIKRFNSHSSLSEEMVRSNIHSKQSFKDMGPYAWTPMTTRTAVGFGLDTHGSRTITTLRKTRPESAPGLRIRRSGSLSSLDTNSSASFTASLITSHASSRGRKSKKGYMEKNVTLCVHAFPNGNRSQSVRVTAKNLFQVLEEATEKLCLPSAGRKIFLPDGTEVTFAHQLSKDCAVYISMGEPFKDPYQSLRENERIRLSSSWTISGIMLPEEKTCNKKASLSKRMKELVESQKYRVLVFKNGDSRDCAEVVCNRFDEFLDDCTLKLGLNSSARALYDWQGKEIKCFSEVPVINDTMQTSHGSLLGPVWVTKGERFSPTGSYDFIMSAVLDLKEKVTEKEKRLELLEARKSGKEVADPEMASRSIAEVQREISEAKDAIEGYKATLKTFKVRLKILKKMSQEEESFGSSYKFQHIAEVSENSRLVGTKSYRLKIWRNGDKSSDAIVVYFSSKDLRKGKRTQDELLQSFFSFLNSNQSLKEAFIGHGRRAEFKRAFLLNGTEVLDVDELCNDAEIWLSLGEDFIPIEYDIIGLTTEKVKLLNLWNERSFLQRDLWPGADDKQAKASLWTATSVLSISEMDKQVIEESTIEEQKVRLVQDVNENRIRNDNVFLQNKKDKGLVLYPELQVIRKGRDDQSDFWGEDAMQWIFTQDGTIMNKQFMNLVLSVKDQAIAFLNGETRVEGFAVGFAMREIPSMLQNNSANEGKQRPQEPTNPRQKWKLTPNGQIMSALLPDFYLTTINGLRTEAVVPNIEKSDEAAQNKEKSSNSSLSDSDSKTSSENDSDKIKKKKKKVKKKKKKDKKKWWNFGSSSSSDSSDGENEIGREKRKSAEDIRVRMKGTSSDDERTPVVAGETEGESGEGKESERIEGGGDNQEGSLQQNEAVKTAAELLKELPDVFNGERIGLSVFERFGDKDPIKIRQRWAIKTEDAAALISSSTLSGKWIRQELAWPVNEADTWVEDALSGYLLSCAPKLKRKLPNKKEQSSPFFGQPARLKVLKNGEHDVNRAVIVVGPDLSNMTRKVTVSLPLKWKKSKGDFQETQSASIAEVEFEQFLDRCTEAMNLPFAARRLFTDTGKELTSVKGLERDQLVYVSSGDAWINPTFTHSEQQRRSLLANLASDVNRMRNYITLREQTDFLLQVNGPLQSGSSVVVSKKSNEDLQVAEEDSPVSPEEILEENQIRDLQSLALTSHQIAHIKSEERLQNIRERLQMGAAGMASDDSTGDATSAEFTFSNPSLGRKFSRSMEPVSKPFQNAYYEWVYQDGFIQLKANKKLVIGVNQSDKSKYGQEIVICNKKVEDASQRWMMSDLGFFHLKSNANLVLTVSTPPLQTDPFSESHISSGYDGSPVILARRLDCFNGNSHQMFKLDEMSGLIFAFATDLTNTEVTAAIKASACTYSVLGAQSLYQPGYIVLEGTRPGAGPVRVCESCAKAIRGKLKLEKIATVTHFTCAFGSPGKSGLSTNGSFKCLSSKVDLSQKEAASSLFVWEKQLKRLQQESSVRIIAYELNLAQTTPSVRICAHRNGDTHYTEGVLVIANSINQFLDICTYKLGLTQAARKLYTSDGQLITDMNQLLQPYYPELCLPLSRSYGEKKSQETSEEKRPELPEKDLSTNQKQTSDSGSVASDGTFTLPSREDTPSGHSLASRRQVSFAEMKAETKLSRQEDCLKKDRMDVRIPIDVWVSCGEPFTPFKDSEMREIRIQQERGERSLVADYLEQEKHLLRQLQGRRYAGRLAAQGSDSTVKPVLSKSLDYPSKKEELLEKSIEELQVHLSELKTFQEREQLEELCKQRTQSSKIYTRMQDRKLYDLPRGITILAYPNGESVARAVPVVATTFLEFLDRATSRLDLNSVARRAFTKEGNEITDLNNVEKNQLICVTCGEKFVPTTERRYKIEMRASWSRANRGSDVSQNANSIVTSDTMLALPAPPPPAPNSASRTKSAKHEETLHVFESDKAGSQNTSRPVRPKSSRPKSANRSSVNLDNADTASRSKTTHEITRSPFKSACPGRVTSARPKSAMKKPSIHPSQNTRVKS
ncbi:doublecortin domain-containing protein 1-like [Rhopilema esculentum]|uniref:doublecortin domain-containing protein 1-like n=1 Tax=Rhopilema esculentum TaxID=499914 RepID=UPI0031E11BEC